MSNVTLLCLPIEKLFQSITPRVEPGCVITRPFPWLAIVPVPATYVPPCGSTPGASVAWAKLEYLIFVLSIHQAQWAIQLGFGDVNSAMKRMHATSSDDLPCECGLPAKPGQRYCPICFGG
ncbi:hypothetical protein RW095_03430 [Paraburkholderia kirstenboschensis]|uniref:Zinc ribbon domain-containing protein n=1 Tax=Paraburkholderia kirstenboschensis TaxID=1245436 RepID=A0ABZ0EBB2_9BURK|nr:hypothetical protein [Paraburkholderia kirstenboschensis]WOD14516.1 hypothetical protein RW095_03430 [Paraburkholderia kirstenboschensis]